MKKLKAILLCAFVLVMVTGCGGKVVTCKKDQEASDYKGYELYEATFKEDKITHYKQYFEVKHNNTEDFNQAKSSVDDAKEQIESYGMIFSSSAKNNVIIIQGEGDMDDILKAAKNDDNSDFAKELESTTEESYKELMQENGYTCE